MLKSYNEIKLSLYASSTLIALSLLSGFILSSSTSFADVVDDVVVTVPVSCNMASELDEAHTATINPGQYQSDIGTTNFTVFCNNNSGYAIYAIGYSNEEYGNTKMLATINNELSPANDINTGINTSGGNSSWSMKLVPVTTASSGTEQPYTPTIESDTNGSFANYHVIPEEYTKVATFTSNTDFTIGSSLQSTYQVYIDGTKPAGTYAGKVKYTLVHPNDGDAPLQPQTTASGKICYYANASDTVGTMGCQTIPESGETDDVSPTSATLLASNFSRTGYGFAGWSDAFDYQTNENANFYGPSETITYENGQYVGEGKGLSLYAVWVKSAGNLQDTNKVAELCGTGPNALTAAPTTGANLSSVSALTDQRDQETYAIAKLADGNCWMIENLRLEAEDTRTAEKQALAQGYGASATYGNFSGLAKPEFANFGSTTTANSLYYSGIQSGDAAINIGTIDNPDDRFPRYNNLNTPADASNRPQSPTRNSFSNNNATVGMYSYGNYYTWHAAIADTTYYSSGDHNTTSICPTGWQIPLGDTSIGNIEQGASDSTNKVGSFSYLDRKMGGTGTTQNTTAASIRWRKFPNNFLYSGVFGDSITNGRGNLGFYWSSTAVVSGGYDKSYYFLFSNSFALPGTNIDSKSLGLGIRCTVSAGT